MQFRKRLRVLLLLVMVLVLLAGNAFAAYGQLYFIKFDGISGNAQDPKHEGWIEVLSYRGKSTDSGKNYILRHRIDTAYPALMEACMRKKVIPTATLEICHEVDGETQAYGQIIMTDVFVNSIQVDYVDLFGDGIMQLVSTIDITAKSIKYNYPSIPPDNPLPKTGDESPLLLWILLATGSISVLLLSRKRNMQQ